MTLEFFECEVAPETGGALFLIGEIRLGMKNLFFCIVIALLAGCSTTQHLKMYGGQTPDQLPALVKPTEVIRITSVDGKAVNINPNHSDPIITEYELEFLPGRHVLHVAFQSLLAYSPGEVLLVVDLKPGRKYVIRDERLEGNKWRPKLIDVTDRPKCWTTQVGMFLGPMGCS